MNRGYGKGFIFIALILIPGFLFSQSSQWRGEKRTGYYPSGKLLDSWPENGPEMLFKNDQIGKGYSTPVMEDDIIYITGKIDTMDHITALNLSGEILWQVPYGRSWKKSFPESRSTPTIDGNNIYIISGQGELACLNKKNGAIKWKQYVMKNYEGVYGSWGTAESPLVGDDHVYFTAAGPKTTLVAYNKENGELVWATESLDDTCAYASPIFINHNNQKMVVALAANHIFGVDVKNGQILWKYHYGNIGPSLKSRTSKNINPNAPLYHDGLIYVTSGYNHVGLQLALNKTGTAVKQVWTDETLDVHLGGVVKVGDYIYGSNWINNRKGNWCCINWKTGETSYEHEWNNKGSIIYSDGLLYVYEEHRGHVGLIRPNPEKFDLIGSFRIQEGSGPHWAHPSIYDGKLLVRHGAVLMVYNIKQE
jgi:outer membrane protein assembly factor BamB